MEKYEPIVLGKRKVIIDEPPKPNNLNVINHKQNATGAGR